MKNNQEQRAVYGLIAGRHDLPVCGYILDEVEDVLDFIEIQSRVARFVEEHCNVRVAYDYAVNQADDESIRVFTGDKLDVIVTGLSSVTAALVAVCAQNGVDLTLWHYDRDSGGYVPQSFWF